MPTAGATLMHPWQVIVKHIRTPHSR